MLFMINYNTPESHDICASCMVNIDMEKLRTVNLKLHDWITKLNEDDTVELANTDVLPMYEAIMHDAQSNETGCIKPVKPVVYKKMLICADFYKAHEDASKINESC